MSSKECEIGCPEDNCTCEDIVETTDEETDTIEDVDEDFEHPLEALYNDDEESICQVLTNLVKTIDTHLTLQNKLIHKIAKTLEKSQN